jgi:DNA-damage-inducible protein J
MSTNTTIQLRIDKATKDKAQVIFKKMGLDMSSATKMFLSQVVRTKSIPFTVRTVNGFTPEYERELLKDIAYAKKYGKRFKTVEALMKDLNS